MLFNNKMRKGTKIISNILVITTLTTVLTACSRYTKESGIYEIDTKKGDEVLLNTAKVYPGADERTSSYSQYFSWINNTNEGSTEE